MGKPDIHQPVKDPNLEAFRRAVEAKAHADAPAGAQQHAGEAARNTSAVAHSRQRDVHDPQDSATARTKNSRHGKVTADKWNQ